MAKQHKGIEFNDDTVRPANFRPPKYVERFPSGAIAVGDWVAIDYATTTKGSGAHVRKAAINDQSVCGVAMEAASGASTTVPIRVQVEGVFSLDEGKTASNVVSLNAAVAVGDNLMISTATAGMGVKLVQATPNTSYSIGHCTVAPSSSQGGVDICNPLSL